MKTALTYRQAVAQWLAFACALGAIALVVMVGFYYQWLFG
jgi:hypothetical protein